MQQDVIEFAIELVRACGEQLRRVSTVTPEYKTDFQDLVTDYDRSIEEQIHHALKERFPAHSVLGEERVRESGDHLWILDPIDGTTNFVSQHRDFAISLAYYHKKQPVFGIVYDVMRDELFLGVHGKGAWKNKEQMAPLRKKETKECILDAGMHVLGYIKRTYDCDPLTMQDEFRAHRYLGCASLSIVHIAQGLSDLYLSAHVKCWDYAAAAIILEEVQGAYSIQNSFFTTTGAFAIFANRRSLITMVETKYLQRKEPTLYKHGK